MKVTVKHINSGIDSKNHEFFNNFIKFLQKEIPLKEDVTILFLGERQEGHMSTGSRNKNHIIKVLSKNRLNRDVCRTLAHEWSHEYQHSILKRKKGPNIGGKNENDANADAGILVKKFEKNHPNQEPKMYLDN